MGVVAKRLRAAYTPGLRTERGRSSGVEHDLAKVGVEGSNPFARSIFSAVFRQFLITSDARPVRMDTGKTENIRAECVQDACSLLA